MTAQTMPQLDEQLPAFALTAASGERVEVDELIYRGPVVLAAVEADGDNDPRAAMLTDLADRLGGGSGRLVVISPGASVLGSGLAAAGVATWLQDATGEAFAALGLVYKRIGRTRRLGGLFVIDVDRRLRFAFTSAAREAWIPGSFVLSRLDRLGAVGPVAAPKPVPVDTADGDAEPELERLVAAVGRRLGMDSEQLEDLVTATRVRDIGMTTVPDEIITKDGPLDDDEWDVIRMHPERSADMLDPELAGVRETVRASHEHMDGSGYPHGLHADRIPLGARILLAVESYLAMTQERPYGGMLSDRESLERVRLSAGRIYDPEVVAALAAEVDSRAAAA
jgi:hypothetical protein